MVRIVRNVEGVPGLHIAYDVFSEEAERRIFTSFSHLDNSHFQPGRRTHGAAGPASPLGEYWTADYTRLSNAVKDCGLVDGYVPPDYCLPLLYPPGASFSHHYDSRTRWGEVIVGVNLGREGEMLFVPQAKHDKEALAARTNGKIKSVRVKMPRRSIYVMSGPSRLDWKHGVVSHKVTKNDPPLPSWNPHNMRKSLTFRSTKVFSDVYFERKIQDMQNMIVTERNDERRRKHEETLADLTTRQRSQLRFKASGDYGKGSLSGADLLEERRRAASLLDMMASGSVGVPADLRFDPSEVTFPLPPGVPTGGSYDAAGGFAVGAFAGGGFASSFLASTRAIAVSAFRGEGRRLGRSADNRRVDEDGEDDDIAKAKNASLRSLAEERAKRQKCSHEKSGVGIGGSDGMKHKSEKKGDSNGENDVIDLADVCGDEYEEKKRDDEDETPKKTAAKSDDNVIVIDD